MKPEPAPDQPIASQAEYENIEPDIGSINKVGHSRLNSKGQFYRNELPIPELILERGESNEDETLDDGEENIVSPNVRETGKVPHTNEKEE